MVFSDATVMMAWAKAQGKCECERNGCGHDGRRCNKQLLLDSQGKESEQGWEAHHINSNGGDTISNCEILCQDCHKNTQSYGR